MADPPIDDQELLRQLAKGNEAAFDCIYRRQQGPIYRFALHMSGNPGVAEEITQEVFMALVSNPKNYDPAKGPLAGYLFGIARNLTRRAVEHSRGDLPLIEEAMDGSDCSWATDPDDDPLAELSQTELLDRLRTAVLSLPEQYREVVVLCDLQEMTYPDAAEILQCAPGTIASRLHRARTMLKMKLADPVQVQGRAK